MPRFDFSFACRYLQSRISFDDQFRYAIRRTAGPEINDLPRIKHLNIHPQRALVSNTLSNKKLP